VEVVHFEPEVPAYGVKFKAWAASMGCTFQSQGSRMW